jgi:hypothetical protein
MDTIRVRGAERRGESDTAGSKLMTRRLYQATRRSCLGYSYGLE